MRRNAVRPFQPGLECLEARDVPSALPTYAQTYLQPLANQEAAASSAALARLKAEDTTLTSYRNGSVHPSLNTAATVYAQAAADYQEVLTERRTLELSFLSILNFFGNAIQTGGDFNNDVNTFANVVEPQLNGPRQTVISNETQANALAVVQQGVNTTATAGFATTPVLGGGTSNSDIILAALLPSKGANIVHVPPFDYSQALWPLAYSAPGGYTPPANP